MVCRSIKKHLNLNLLHQFSRVTCVLSRIFMIIVCGTKRMRKILFRYLKMNLRCCITRDTKPLSVAGPFPK